MSQESFVICLSFSMSFGNSWNINTCFWDCNKTEEEHTVETIEEEYNATRSKDAQIMLIKSLISPTCGRDTREGGNEVADSD